MKIQVIAVGRLRQPHWRSAADLYLGRLQRAIPAQEIEVRSAHKDERRNPSAAIAREGKALLGAVSEGAVLVALDERGKTMDTEAFAAFIHDHMLYHTGTLSFIVGGALGLDRTVRQRADRILSLSAMTMPHELARVVLWEQLYRAMTVIRGEPYHKA
ncbi:MAG: 23S rRNA (pseudouridine(1915)-N(3))-methyltransferase RlmH [Myxococcota bacterium]